MEQRARALGYASVTPDGEGVDEQRRALEGACESRRLELVDFVHDPEPDEHASNGRPALRHALERIDAGEAACLIVNDLQHLGRRVGPFAAVLDRLERQGTRLVALNVGLDTATEAGRLATTRRSPQPEPRPEPRPEPPPEPEPQPEPAPPPASPPREEPALREAARALGYASVPADAEGTLELDAQKAAIERWARGLGIELIEVICEREPRNGKALDRAGLSFLIERIAGGDASCIVVSGLERLSRSVAELGTIVRWLERNDVRLLAINLDLDSASPGGRTTVRALASVAGWEHERLSDRTRKGLAAAREKRRAGGGGSAPDWAAIRKRIATMRADGMTLQAIADVLNEEGVPTMRGGTEWRKSSVQTAAGYRRRSRAKGVDDLPIVEKATDHPRVPDAGAP